ncbi:hypothetical protein R1flu_007494 [Riccia fluitans]|uniref:Phosphatidylinositol-3,4,5-trisphosphate 3-phosphatase n=1 Tax=Riccia fluitans TaxID=41844 RepID=A0ABD1YZA1_9MARC
MADKPVRLQMAADVANVTLSGFTPLVGEGWRAGLGKTTTEKQKREGRQSQFPRGVQGPSFFPLVVCRSAGAWSSSRQAPVVVTDTSQVQSALKTGGRHGLEIEEARPSCAEFLLAAVAKSNERILGKDPNRPVEGPLHPVIHSARETREDKTGAKLVKPGLGDGDGVGNSGRSPLLPATKPGATLQLLVSASHFIRLFVSKRRRRLLVEGYDLDLSYITPRLLAMSYPAQNMQAFIRNPMWQVQRALDLKHGGHYKVYNLCCEATYDPENFHGRVEELPFDDNHVPPLALIKKFCESVQQWLDEDPDNVAVIHCRAGKGRTGLMVCAYLVYGGMGPEEALAVYATKRTYNNEGVTIASQRRYVGYWSKVLVFPNGSQREGIPEVRLPAAKTRHLRSIRFYDTVNTDCIKFNFQQGKEIPGQLYVPQTDVTEGFCKPLKQNYRQNSSPRYYLSFLPNEDGEEGNGESQPRWVAQMETDRLVVAKKSCLDHQFDKPLSIAGDVRATFYDKNNGRLFYACFNTFFIANSIIQLGKGDLDKVGKRARAIFGPGFCLEMLFEPADSRNHLPHPNSVHSFV